MITVRFTRNVVAAGRDRSIGERAELPDREALIVVQMGKAEYTREEDKPEEGTLTTESMKPKRGKK